MKKIRSWIARCQWEGRKPFIFGTFFTDENDNYASAEKKARDLAVKSFEEILPLKVPPPDKIVLIPGMIWFIEEEEKPK